MRAKLTKRLVESTAPGVRDIVLWDDAVTGFFCKITPAGRRTYGVYYRTKNGAERRPKIGEHGTLTVDQARDEARVILGDATRGKDFSHERKAARVSRASGALVTVDTVLDKFLDQYAAKLRSHDEIKRDFDKYVRPRIGRRPLYELRRSEIADVLDKIEKHNGPVMADRCLAWVRKAFNWWAGRDDKFNSPIVRGMARTKPKQRARSRVLSDDEIRAVWEASASTEPSVFGPLVRTLLLTAQRREEVSQMRWDEIDFDAKVWTIPAGRYKTNRANAVPLSDAVLEVLEAQEAQVRGALGVGPDEPLPRMGEYVFSTTLGRKPFSGHSKAKKKLDTASHTTGWTLHDLRRTARTLMSRAGVSSDHAERVLGHVINGVAGIYDQHDYLDQKRDALDKLAKMVADILAPKPDNVVKLDKKRKGAA